MSEKLYIAVEKAYNLVAKLGQDKATLKFPYTIRYKDDTDKLRKAHNIPLKFLMNAITLNDLNHPETEDVPEPVDIRSIVSCYLMGSAVKPVYEKVVKKYMFGLYVNEKNKRVIPNDIDIFCLTNNTRVIEHIKSITSWSVTINSSYHSYSSPRYANFDISYYPVSHRNCAGNLDFINHIKDCGVCIMGKNIIGARKYACWHHNTIKNEVVCAIPKSFNISEEQIEEEEQNKKMTRFELMNL